MVYPPIPNTHPLACMRVSDALTESETTLIAELDQRQDSVLDELDVLNEKIMETLSAWTAPKSSGEAPLEEAA